MVTRREVIKAAAMATAALPARAAFAQSSTPAPAGRAGDPWRGLKVGVASYTLRKMPLDAAIRAIQRVDLHYVSIKDAHLPMNSTAEERRAVAQR
ncbi:MAG TPA: sugar phosphate isomerase/epimerase, partial [Vicinamibacteria bacterium]